LASDAAITATDMAAVTMKARVRIVASIFVNLALGPVFQKYVRSDVSVPGLSGIAGLMFAICSEIKPNLRWAESLPRRIALDFAGSVR
jgi:hypothetical protein